MNVFGFQPGRSSGVVDTSGISAEELLERIEVLEQLSGANPWVPLVLGPKLEPSLSLQSTAYRILGGNIQLRGGLIVKPGESFKAGDLLFTLPASVRPLRRTFLPSVFAETNTGVTVVVIEVAVTGSAVWAAVLSGIESQAGHGAAVLDGTIMNIT